MDTRLRAICDLSVPSAREDVGRHEYDGVIQDLSPDGVRRDLAALGGPAGTAPYADPHDEAQAAAAEDALRARFGELELQRANPFVHLANLDLSCYDRAYAPADEREAARRAHLKGWPEAIRVALETLDRLPAPLAQAALPAARGLTGYASDDAAAQTALAGLVRHLEHAAEHGEPSAVIGGAALGRLLSSAEAQPVDLTRLAAQADAERDRLRTLLDEACRRIEPAAPAGTTVRALLADHPDADGVLASARALTEEVIAWTADRGLVPYDDGECRVGLTPASQPWQVATMTGAAPYEADAPSWFRVNPPDPSWSRNEQSAWLEQFSHATLPVIAVHEVAPGHFSHWRALRHAPTDVRRTLLSEGFIEGWAHYTEELALEEGFRADDPRFAVGVARDALWRVTRMACTIGVHTGAMSVTDAAQRFTADVFLDGPAALNAARRGITHPTSGLAYTWGKLAILELRQRARTAWGIEFSLPRFHSALLGLGAPPLGLLGTALEHR